jgi:hypothetical protein
MVVTEATMKKLTRADAIEALRAKLLTLTDDEHSMCWVATKSHAFCGGFSQWKFDELRRRHAQIVRSRPHISRPELEELADRWQLARQFVQGTLLACDTQTKEHDLCRGWDEFTDEKLAEFCKELLDEPVEIVPGAASGPLAPPAH